MKKNKGFSLVELLVALLIFGIFVAVSIALGRNAIQRASIIKTVNNFLADFSYLKQSAARENRYFALEFNNLGTSYTIYKQRTIGDLDTMDEVKFVTPLDGTEFFSSTDVQHFAVNSVGEVFAYDPTGSPRIDTSQVTGRQLLFAIRSKGGEGMQYQRRITIYPSGGINVRNE